MSKLPIWNLTEIYSSITDKEIDNDIKSISNNIETFSKKYNNELAKLSAAELFNAIVEYEDISEDISRIYSFASLHHQKNQLDENIGKFWQKISETLNLLSSELIFFTLQLAQVENSTMQAWLDSKEIGKYKIWLQDILRTKPFQLEQSVEQVLLQKYNTSSSAWIRLYDETMAAYEFDVNGEKKRIAQVLHDMTDKESKVREDNAKAFSKGLDENISLNTRIYNVLILDKNMEDSWRGFAKPFSSRNLDNQIEDNIVEALASAVTKKFTDISHKYYHWKAKEFGKKQIPYWDRNAPLPYADDRKWSFDEARDFILSSYQGFSPTIAELGKQFFDNNWIDAEPNIGKNSGAFAHPTVPSWHPFILVNWYGTNRDVMTLAHELGHGIHQLLAAKQGLFLSSTPLTFAETASVFGEMLTFQKLLENQKNEQDKKVLIASKIEDMINTVIRQIAFHNFETQAHAMRQQGELSANDLSSIWMQTQTDALGDAIALDDNYKNWWSYVSHFYHVPFYVYAYAFGDCLVNSLYKYYQNDKTSGFTDKYINMLATGGAQNHKELLSPFNFNIENEDFWLTGLNLISEYIDML